MCDLSQSQRNDTGAAEGEMNDRGALIDPEKGPGFLPVDERENGYGIMERRSYENRL